MNRSVFETLKGYVQESESVLLVLPSRASIDDWCGLLALRQYLESLGKKVTAFCENKIPHSLEFLGQNQASVHDILPEGDFVISLKTDQIKVDRLRYQKSEGELEIVISPVEGRFSPQDVSCRETYGNFGVVIGFGVEDLKSLESLISKYPGIISDIPFVNISTKANGNDIGRLSLCFPEKSSVCEIVYDFFQKIGFESLSPQISTMLLTGVVAATESFLNKRTSREAFEIASKLQASGGAQSEIIEHIFKQKSFLTLKLWGEILQSLSIDPVHRLAWASLSASDFESLGADMSDFEDVTRLLIRFVEGVDVALLTIEQRDGVQVQLRSSFESFDYTALKKLSESCQNLEEGIDLEFLGGDLAQVQSKVLSSLLELQKSRLRIDESLPLKAVDLRVDFFGKEKRSERPRSNLSLKAETGAPSDIPFEVKGIDIIKEKDIKAKSGAPVSKASSEKGLPGWMK